MICCGITVLYIEEHRSTELSTMADESNELEDAYETRDSLLTLLLDDPSNPDLLQVEYEVNSS